MHDRVTGDICEQAPVNQTKRDLSVRGRCDLDKERGITRPATASVTRVLESSVTVPTVPLDATKSLAVTVDASMASLKLTLRLPVSWT